MHIAFAHLDLGIGGAEQLVVNAALALISKGHQVTLYTTHHSVNHCFAQTRGDGILAKHVIVVGDWLPRSLYGGKGISLCSSIRMIYLALYMILRPPWYLNEDVLFLDGVSTPIPLFRLRYPVLFYCHFPDLLLCTDRVSFLKRIYRAPLDIIEQLTTGLAHAVVVNSCFTKGVFQKTFPFLKDPGVLYPVADFDSFTPPNWIVKNNSQGMFVSLNRFERKKNIELAIRALAVVRDNIPKQMEMVPLVVAGGYDPTVTENVEYLEELKGLAQELNLEGLVHFKPSVSDAVRNDLLQLARCVIYTPNNEHFGIVPIEAMYAGAPVLAVASGGPLETVKHGKTGFLCPNTPEEFGAAMLKFVEDTQFSLNLGGEAHEHVKRTFGTEAFAVELDELVLLTKKKAETFQRIWLVASAIVLMCAFLITTWGNVA